MIRFLAAIFRILHQSLRNSPQQILPFTIFFDSSNLLGKLQTNSSWIFTCQRGPTPKRGFCYGRPSVIARAFTTWAAAGDGIFLFCRHHHHHFGRHGLAGSSCGDLSERINSSHSIIQEFTCPAKIIFRPSQQTKQKRDNIHFTIIYISPSPSSSSPYHYHPPLPIHRSRFPKPFP